MDNILKLPEKIVADYVLKHDTDIFVFTGPIYYTETSDFVDMICRKSSKRKKCLFFLTTPGGDPHAAYRIIRSLRSKYQEVTLGIMGPCKSAGTLVAIGAHKLIIGDTGELGPLDVQVAKPDEIISSNSGLDIMQALAVTMANAFNTFENWMMEISEDTAGGISTKTAAEIAKDLVVGMFEPISAQIDPNRLGEVQRAIKIAHAYADRLCANNVNNLKPNAMTRLVEQYPSHSFVIDFEEAKLLFKDVVRSNEDMNELAGILRSSVRHFTRRSKFFDVCDQFKVEAKEKNGTLNGNKGSKPNIQATTKRRSRTSDGNNAEQKKGRRTKSVQPKKPQLAKTKQTPLKVVV